METPRGIIHLRPARAGDAAALRELRLKCLQDHPEAFFRDYQEEANLPLSTWQERVQASSGEGNELIMFAEQGGKLVGMSAINRRDNPKTRHTGTIWGVYVLPDWRGLGLAEAMMHACEDWAIQKDITILNLMVVSTNAAAIRCYQRCGFSIYGIEPRAMKYEGEYQNDLMMAKKLT
jgi:ribosomal protein S18 acetylase RimI-like enzyme